MGSAKRKLFCFVFKVIEGKSIKINNAISKWHERVFFSLFKSIIEMEHEPLLCVVEAVAPLVLHFYYVLYIVIVRRAKKNPKKMLRNS